jgi:hypothetical protein
MSVSPGRVGVRRLYSDFMVANKITGTGCSLSCSQVKRSSQKRLEGKGVSTTASPWIRNN